MKGRSSLIFCAVVFWLPADLACARVTEYWTLKTMALHGGSPQYRAFKSKEACDREVRRLVTATAQIKKRFKENASALDEEVYCFQGIPYGYEIAR